MNLKLERGTKVTTYYYAERGSGQDSVFNLLITKIKYIISFELVKNVLLMFLQKVSLSFALQISLKVLLD